MSVNKDLQQADLDFNGFKGENLGAPTSPNDAARLVDITSKEVINVGTPSAFTLLGLVETVVAQWNLEFDVMESANVIPVFSAIARRTGGAGTATFNLRVGGTIGAADGTVRATFSEAGVVTLQKSNTGAAFARPDTAGGDLVKVTVVTDAALAVGEIQGIAISFKGSA